MAKDIDAVVAAMKREADDLGRAAVAWREPADPKIPLVNCRARGGGEYQWGAVYADRIYRKVSEKTARKHLAKMRQEELER